MEHKNIGVYALCRTPVNNDAECCRREARLRGMRNISLEQKNTTFYMDEVKIGERSQRHKLEQLIADAESGKFDLVVIADEWDLWHSPQKAFNAMRKLSQLDPPVAIHSFTSRRCGRLRYSDRFKNWEECLIFDALHVQRNANALEFVYENYDILDKGLRGDIIYQSISPEMIEDYLLSFYLEPRGMEIIDFARMIGVETDDLDIVKECWHPEECQFEPMVEVLGKELIDYFLA